MKLSILLNVLALVTFTSAAEASYFQINCSNADGSIMTGSGHSDNFVQLTKWIPGGKETVRFERGAVHQQETIKSVNLLDESGNNCRKPGEGGVAFRRSVTASTVTFVNADGSLFDENVAGVSKDRKTVKADLICESNMNGMILCPKN